MFLRCFITKASYITRLGTCRDLVPAFDLPREELFTFRDNKAKLQTKNHLKMMKLAILLTAIAYCFFQCNDVSADTAAAAADEEDYKKATSVYDFKAQDIQGNQVSLDQYKGKVLLIVNVASNCGLTEKNYEQLNQLHDKYESKGLRILAFPSNQFMHQEPGTNEEIADFAKKHGVKFDMFAKVDVNGENAHPLYKYLKLSQPGSEGKDGAVEWNFAKFIVDRDGHVVERHIPKKDPVDLIPSLEKYIL